MFCFALRKSFRSMAHFPEHCDLSAVHYHSRMHEEGYKTSTLVRLTGISPALLRAWERRHALLEPRRTTGGHRLYTEDDLAVLRAVQDLLREGRSIGEVAARGREALLGLATSAAPAPAVDSEPPAPNRLLKSLVDAAIEIDGTSVERTLDGAFAALSMEAALERVILPAMSEIGRRWAMGEISVAGEHLISARIVARLSQVLAAEAPHDGPLAIVACFPDELHQVGALCAGLIAAKAGYRVRYLGAALPLEALELVIVRLEPQLVCLSVVRRTLLEVHVSRLGELAKRYPETKVCVGGRGAHEPSCEIPASLHLTPPGGLASLEDLFVSWSGQEIGGR